MKDLWDKLVELHKGVFDAKICKRDILFNQLYNITMKDGEIASQLHARIQDILNDLHIIGQCMEN